MKPSGTVFSDLEVPYDYIIVIDAGSKGSRLFIYQWPNPTIALQKGIDITKLLKTPNIDSYTFPHITSHNKWHKKVKPGITSFSQSPQKIGKHHLKPLLKLAKKVIPRSQHDRTPIFLHSTAGMRLLSPTDQHKVLESVCDYIHKKTNFFLPHCDSHVNVIDGDVEGLYGWLSINYLVGAFDRAEMHQHGKNHSTYGLLDMGGASTQVVFQPNDTEISEHTNNLYKVMLKELPRGGVLENEENEESKENKERESESNKVSSYSTPISKQFLVYSDSFLGLGMSQAYNKYLTSLVDKYKPGVKRSPPIVDPCLPKGYANSINIDSINYDFTGGSDFQHCLKEIFPVITNSTYGNLAQSSGNCHQYDDVNQVSSCLLNDLIPAFDFDINNFFGVSGYWYALSNLMEYNLKDKRGDTSKQSQSYDYKQIYHQTSTLCSKSYSQLLELNNVKDEKHQLQSNDLSSLCFDSSWILNFLHLGLGFPRFGIDPSPPNKDDRFQSLQLVDKINNTEFSWTLGRALLYANDEYIQAFNNISGTLSSDDTSEGRAGFYYSASPAVFHYGSEQSGIAKRPRFLYYRTDSDTNVDYDSDDDYNELKWYIEPHRWYGVLIFGVLIGFIMWLLMGQNGRNIIRNGVSSRFKRLRDRIRGQKYTPVDLEMDDLERT